MGDRGHVSLRERAVRAWRKERPKRAERLSKRAALMLELRETLEGMLGDDLPIKLATDVRGRPIATVEELRFTLTEFCDDDGRKLMLLDSCSRCEAETGVVVDSLADLGQLFEGLEAKVGLGCTECIGLTEQELRPPVITKCASVKVKRPPRS